MSLDALRAGLGDEWPFESFGDYLDAIQRRGTAINVGALVGHTPVRLHVMGEEATEREATPDEVEAMCRLVDDALAAGTDIGPVVDQSQLDQDMSYIDLGQKEGGRLAFGGRLRADSPPA